VADISAEQVFGRSRQQMLSSTVIERCKEAALGRACLYPLYLRLSKVNQIVDLNWRDISLQRAAPNPGSMPTLLALPDEAIYAILCRVFVLPLSIDDTHREAVELGLSCWHCLCLLSKRLHPLVLRANCRHIVLQPNRDNHPRSGRLLKWLYRSTSRPIQHCRRLNLAFDTLFYGDYPRAWRHAEEIVSLMDFCAFKAVSLDLDLSSPLFNELWPAAVEALTGIQARCVTDVSLQVDASVMSDVWSVLESRLARPLQSLELFSLDWIDTNFTSIDLDVAHLHLCECALPALRASERRLSERIRPRRTLAVTFLDWPQVIRFAEHYSQLNQTLEELSLEFSGIEGWDPTETGLKFPPCKRLELRCMARDMPISAKQWYEGLEQHAQLEAVSIEAALHWHWDAFLCTMSAFLSTGSHLPNLRKLSTHVVHQDQVARVSQFHFDQLEALCVKRGVFYERFSS
jgi:hypothetical protein